MMKKIIKIWTIKRRYKEKTYIHYVMHIPRTLARAAGINENTYYLAILYEDGTIVLKPWREIQEQATARNAQL